jgi:hypothetical protein
VRHEKSTGKKRVTSSLCDPVEFMALLCNPDRDPTCDPKIFRRPQ